MAGSQLILELMFLHTRGGCSLTVLLFFLMLVGPRCFILSASLCVVLPTYRASHWHEDKIRNMTTHHFMRLKTMRNFMKLALTFL